MNEINEERYPLQNKPKNKAKQTKKQNKNVPTEYWQMSCVKRYNFESAVYKILYLLKGGGLTCHIKFVSEQPKYVSFLLPE